MNTTRRSFIGNAVMGAAAAVAIPDIVKAAVTNTAKAAKVQLNPGDVVLFQGDSITDAGRDRAAEGPNNSRALGNGYAFLATANLLHQHATKQLSVYNRGISGNKVHQLDERWEDDCLQLKPNVLSILIGVNDYWHTLLNGYTGTLQVYRDDYRKLLDRTLNALPGVKVIIGEPFAINNVKAVTDAWFPAFDAYRQVAKEIADEFQAVFIPYQRVFDEACRRVAPQYWTNDGVHTTLAGAQLMAAAWLEAIKK